jgi:hypothetical protein
MLGVAEVDSDVSGDGDAFVPSHLPSPIPCQRFVEFLRQFAGMFNGRIDDRFAVLASYLHQHDVTCLALDECRNLAAPAAAQKIAFPVARYRAVFNCGWKFAD